ncbi:unnamed protein product, partial [Meganyctiphanes norvegica]
MGETSTAPRTNDKVPLAGPMGQKKYNRLDGISTQVSAPIKINANYKRMFKNVKSCMDGPAEANMSARCQCDPLGGSSNKIENDCEPKYQRQSDKWMIAISVTGVLVCGLIFVLVLYMLLSSTDTPKIVADIKENNQSNIIHDINNRKPKNLNLTYYENDIHSQDNKKENIIQLQGVANSDIFILKVVENMLGSMNQSIDPCEDFYGYSCGNWASHNNAPDDVTHWSNFEEMTVYLWSVVEDELDLLAGKNTQNIDRDAIEQFSIVNTHNHSNSLANISFLSKLHDAEPFLVNLVQTYYEVCQDESKLTNDGASPLQTILNELDLMYQQLTEQISPLDALQQILEYVHHELNVHVFFKWNVQVDHTIAGKMSLEISAPELELMPQGTLVEGNSELIKVYSEYAKNLLQIIGGFTVDTDKEVETIIDLLKVFQPLAGSAYVNETTVGEIEERAPFLNWETYFNKVFNIIEIDIYENNRVLSLVQDYLSNLSSVIIDEIEKHGSKRLYEFIRWQVVQYYSQYLHIEARKAFLPLFDGISGENATNLPDFRYRPCIKELEDHLALPTTYLMKHILQRSLHKSVDLKNEIKNVEIMAENVRKSYIKYIRTFDWLGEKERDILIKKLENVQILVGYPKIIDNLKKLKEKYYNLKFNDSSLIQNHINLKKFNRIQNLIYLKEPATYNDWEIISPMTLISFYAYRRNVLLVPLGGFMYPLYHPSLPDVLLYATMGVFIGHELGHSVDFVGRSRDNNGMANTTLWDKKMEEEFSERVLCRANEYSENYFPIKDLLTIAEIMADDGSVTTAYQSIQNKLQNSISNENILAAMKELELDSHQLFFLQYSQLFCTSSRDKKTPPKGMKHYPPHSIRVQATLANTPFFHQAFGCKKGSGMNPERESCNIW